MALESSDPVTGMSTVNGAPAMARRPRPAAERRRPGRAARGWPDVGPDAGESDSPSARPRDRLGAPPPGDPRRSRWHTAVCGRARSAASTPGSTVAGSRTPPSPRTWPSSPRSAAAPMKRSPVITASRRSRSRATAAASARLVVGGPTTERRTPSMVSWLRRTGSRDVRPRVRRSTAWRRPTRGRDKTLEDALPESERVVAAVSRHFVEGRARARRAAGLGVGLVSSGRRRGELGEVGGEGCISRAAVGLSEAAPPCASSGSAPHPGHCRSGAIAGVRGGCHPRGDGRLSAGSARWCGV